MREARPALESLRPVIEAATRDVDAALAGDVPEPRDALRALFGPEVCGSTPTPRRAASSRGP